MSRIVVALKLRSSALGRQKAIQVSALHLSRDLRTKQALSPAFSALNIFKKNLNRGGESTVPRASHFIFHGANVDSAVFELSVVDCEYVGSLSVWNVREFG